MLEDLHSECKLPDSFGAEPSVLTWTHPAPRKIYSDIETHVSFGVWSVHRCSLDIDLDTCEQTMEALWVRISSVLDAVPGSLEGGYFPSFLAYLCMATMLTVLQ